MPTADSNALRCSAQGCIYSADPGTLGLFCIAHWEMAAPETRRLLRHEFERMGDRPSERWSQLIRIAVELVGKEEVARALAEERGYRPKHEARVA